MRQEHSQLALDGGDLPQLPFLISLDCDDAVELSISHLEHVWSMMGWHFLSLFAPVHGVDVEQVFEHLGLVSSEVLAGEVSRIVSDSANVE